jgi:hypothetical protein
MIVRNLFLANWADVVIITQNALIANAHNSEFIFAIRTNHTVIKHLSFFVYCFLLRLWLENFSPDRPRLLHNYLLFLFDYYFFLIIWLFLFLHFVINQFFYYFCNFLIEKLFLNLNFIGVRNWKYEWFVLF